MPVRIPAVLLVLAAGLTLGLVAVELVGRDAGRADLPAATASSARAPAARRVLDVLHEWDRQRAAAWAAGDAADLAALYVPGSSAGAADVGLLRRYVARGLAVRDLRMQLLGARVLVARPRRIALEVTDRITDAVAVRRDDAAAARRLPVDAASTRVLVLRRVGERWLVARVSEPGSEPGSGLGSAARR